MSRNQNQLTKDEIDFIRRLRTGDIILNGRRVRKASDAIADDDYVTKRQLSGFSQSPSGLLLPIDLSDDSQVTGILGDSHLNDSGVSAGTYGDSTHVGQFTVDAKGRITAASDVAIAVAGSTFRPSLAFFGNTHTMSFTGITMTANASLVIWFWLENALNNYNPIWSKDSNNEMYVGDGGASGKFTIVIGGAAKLRTTTSLTRLSWNLLIITDDGATLKCYLNNADAGDSIGTYAALSGMGNIIRLTQGINANNFTGYLLEAAIFSKALSSGERDSIWNSGAGKIADISVSPWNSSLVAGWHLTEGGSFTVTDYSGNGHSGTLIALDQWTPFPSPIIS